LQSDEPVEDVSDGGRLFIRNLSYTCTEEDLRALFEKYGPLTELNLPVDKNSNRTTGFAFVTFMMPEHAVKVLSELDGKIFQGRIMHLLPGRAQKSKQEKEISGWSKQKCFIYAIIIYIIITKLIRHLVRVLSLINIHQYFCFFIFHFQNKSNYWQLICLS